MSTYFWTICPLLTTIFKLANRQVMGVSNQGGPDAALIGSAEEDEEPECRHDEAEDGDEHHPAQRVFRRDAGRCHQDPHQTPEHLKGHTGEGGGERQFLW